LSMTTGWMMMSSAVFDDERIKVLYARVVAEPAKEAAKKNLIRCPECGEEILMIPTLRVMNVAIENHVCLHREQLRADPIRGHQKAISIRLALMGQVLQRACRQQIT
jgi:hypothetical protein